MSFSGPRQSASYSCTALIGSNKTGALTPDGDGYYTLVLGALDSFNSAGAFYPLEPAKKIFEGSSSLMRRIQAGNCKGECGHPKPLPGQSTREFLQRVISIEETNVCCHFRDVHLETDHSKNPSGKPVVLVIGSVKPTGPKGPALKEALENRHENVCFSIRSLTNDYTRRDGILQKELKTVVTWDWVTEPGIEYAQRWNSPALESLGEVEFVAEHLSKIEEESARHEVAVESAVDLPTLRSELGWEAPSPGSRPRSANW